MKLSLTYEFLDRFLYGIQCPLLIDLTGQNLSESLLLVFKRNVFVLSDLSNVGIHSMAIVANR